MMPGHTCCPLPRLCRALAVCCVLFVDINMVASCHTGGNSNLFKSVDLAEKMRKDAGELRRMYIRRQGDFTKSFCQMPVDDAPDPEVTGLEPSEKLQSIYTKLKLFQEHLTVVIDQQMQLQEPSDSLLSKLKDAKTYLSYQAGNVNAALQCLRPNELISEPSVESISNLPRNTFQQKVYGCVVLTRHKEFLSRVYHELKNLRSKVQR